MNELSRKTQRNRAQGGFTLIELMIVVAIIGILAAIAVPRYQDYTIRAQATEGFTATAGLRTDIALYVAENGNLDDIDDDTELATAASEIQGRYIDASGVEIASNAISITFNSDANAALASGSPMTITPQVSQAGGQISSWVCAAGFDSKYLPSACR
jgi:type IV pilus assembly protein PilA